MPNNSNANSTKTTVNLVCVIALCVAAFYFTHRAWSAPQLIRGDTFQNLYFLLNADLIRADHNPYQWHYASYMPFIGMWNPVLQLVQLFVGKVAALDGIARVFWTAWIASACLLSGVTASFFIFFRRLGFDAFASVAGSLVVSFTGFHLVGVYEFNHMYLLSYLCVPWVVFWIWRMQASASPMRYSARAGLGIGASLLGGSNAPMFYFLPVLALFPFLISKKTLSFKSRLGWLAWVLLSVGCGMLTAACVLVPGALFLSDTNRAELGFVSGIGSLSWKEKIYTLFLREWWRMHGAHLHESDFYLGVGAITLLGLGLWQVFSQLRKRQVQVSHREWLILFGVLGLFGFTVCHLDFLPSAVQAAISNFFQALSIRHPNRFFTVLLLPIGYLVAVGFSNLSLKRTAIALSISLLVALTLSKRVLEFQFEKLLAETQFTFFALSVVVLLFAFSLLTASYLGGRSPKFEFSARAASLFFLFLGFAWAPLQISHYAPDYVGSSVPLQGRIPGMGLATFAGLKPDYIYNFKQLEAALLHPPAHLAHLKMGDGGILDDADFGPGRRHYHAPQTRLRFPFTSIYDPASPRALTDLAKLDRDAIWDMSGICWRLRGTEIARRPECFAQAYFVPHAVTARTGTEALQWLHAAETKTLRDRVVLECSSGFCPENLSGAALGPQLGVARSVQILQRRPGMFEMHVPEGAPGFVILSVPYRMDWKVTSDTGEKRVYRANHAFMAVQLRHHAETLKFELDPFVARIGSWISWTTALWLFALSFLRLPKSLSQPSLLAEPN